MGVVKYSDFLILEAKKQKEEVEQGILGMLDKKPEVETSKWWPNEKGIYSQAGIIRYFKDRFTDSQISGALNDLGSKIKHINVKNSEYKSNYPYYFVGLSSDEANKIKAKYEEEDKEKLKAKPAAKKPVAKEKPKRVSPSTKSPVKKKEKKK